MSRYILIPIATNDGGDDDSFSLVPTEGFDNQLHHIDIPRGLVVFKNIFSRQRRKTKIKKLLQQLSKTEICSNEKGQVCTRQKTFDVNFNDAVIDSCNGHFRTDYEEFYSLLRANGITF